MKTHCGGLGGTEMADNIKIILPSDPAPELIEKLRTAFPDAVVEAPDELEERVQDTLTSLETAVAESIAGAANFAHDLDVWWSGLPGGAMTLFWMLVALLGGYAVERAVDYLLGRPGRALTEPESELQRLAYAFRWLFWRIILLVIFIVVTRILGRLLLPADPALREFAFAVLASVLFGRVLLILLAAVIAPDAPARRLMGFNDAVAADAYKAGLILASITVLLGTAQSVASSAAPGVGSDIPLIFILALNGAASIWFFLTQRHRVARLMQGGPDRGEVEARSWRYRLASHWSTIFILLIVVDVTLKVLSVFGAFGPTFKDGIGPVVLVAALAALGVAELRILSAERVGKSTGPWVFGAFVFAEGILIVGSIVLIIGFWGIDPFSPPAESGVARFLPAMLEAGLVTVIGVSIWRTVSAFLGADAAGGESTDGDAEMGGEGSREQTIRPIVRGFALTVIGVTTGMMALSALGANIGPLIASAGVFGLAIGFGAQKLVSDVVSGLFYLYEDALRVGEYIVTGSGKGTVERISIRSAKLRHHNGPIYTIPFSEMGTIQNHSRDFVVMKFSFLVPDLTDLEMVRKLVKKAGQELAGDPELEDKLIAPLKSQGAISIQGKNYEIGCKFTARPGQQFVIRRKAYAILQKALQEKGINLSSPAITVPAS